MAPHDSGIVAGIDLGTVFSSLGVLSEEGEVRLIANCDGNPLTPSAIYFETDGIFESHLQTYYYQLMLKY